MRNSKEELFERMPIPKAVASLCVPTILSCIVMVIYNLADTFFVGLLNDAAETSAVTLAAPVILAFNAVNNLFGVGTSSVMSRALGVKDHDTVKKSSAFGFYGAIFSGLIFSACVLIFKNGFLQMLGAKPENVRQTADYLFWTVICGAVPSILNVVMGSLVRAEGSAMHASIGTMSGCLLNILLDPFFILPWGLGMGASGAGLATLISNSVACLYFLIFVAVKKDKTFVCVRLSEFRPTGKLVGDVAAVGVPSAIQNLLNVTGMTVLNNFMAAYGAEAVSAMGIAHKTALVPMYIAMGFGQGIMPLVGYNFASGNRRRMRDSIVFAGVIEVAFMAAVTCAVSIFSENAIRLFMENRTIVTLGGAFLRAQILAQPFLCIDFLAVGVFQACGMGKRAFVYAVMRKVVFEIPALVVLNRLFPMYGLAYAPLVAEVVLAGMAIFSLKKILTE